MVVRGQLQLTGALITNIHIGDVGGCHVAISLESALFVDLLGTNRIRLVFCGCLPASLDQLVSHQDSRIHGLYVSEEQSNVGGRIAYLIQTSNLSDGFSIVAREMQVEVDKTTHPHH